MFRGRRCDRTFDLKTLIYDEHNVKTPVVIPTKKIKIKINLLKKDQLIWKQKLWKLYFNIMDIKNNKTKRTQKDSQMDKTWLFEQPISSSKASKMKTSG